MSKNALIVRILIFVLLAGGIGYLYYDHEMKLQKEKLRPKGNVPMELVDEIEAEEKPERGRVGALPTGIFTNVPASMDPVVESVPIPVAGPVMPSVKDLEEREIIDAVRKVKITKTAERSIVGTVVFVGEPPSEIPIQMTPAATKIFEAAYPGRKKQTQFYRVGKQGGLGDVLVKLDGELPVDTDSWGDKEVSIRHRGMMIEPYVSVVNGGQILLFHNDDQDFHSVHIHGKHFENGDISQLIFPGSPPYQSPLTAAEENVALTSDQYPWIYGYLHVMEHKYHALTVEDGRFTIPVPAPGKYEVVANHQKFGVIIQEVEIGETGGLKVEFTYQLAQ